MNAWEVFWVLFVFIPLTILWVVILFDMMGRRDLVGWQKALWAMVIVFFPWIGACAYLIVRPSEAPFPAYAGGMAPGTPAPTGAPAPGTQAAPPRASPPVAPEQFPADTPAAQA